MKTYARLDGAFVVEIILPQQYDAEDPEWQEGDASRIGEEIPIELRFHPSLVANMVDITDVNPQPQYGWIYNADLNSFSEPNLIADDNNLADICRQQRDYLMRHVYDAGIMMAQRSIRMAITQEEKSYSENKIIELDIFAQELQGVPEQEGFPHEINWPEIPAK
jgi:hypothetical protein